MSFICYVVANEKIRMYTKKRAIKSTVDLVFLLAKTLKFDIFGELEKIKLKNSDLLK